MSESYNADDFIPDSTGEIGPTPDPDEERRRVKIPVDEAKASTEGELKQPIQLTSPPAKKQPVRRVNRAKGRQTPSSDKSIEKKKPILKASNDKLSKKFTIQVPEEVLRKFRIQALTEGMTYSALGVEALQLLLAARKIKTKEKK